MKGPLQICLFAGFILICSHNSTSASAVWAPRPQCPCLPPTLHCLPSVLRGPSRPAPDSPLASSSALPLTPNPSKLSYALIMAARAVPKHTTGLCAPCLCTHSLCLQCPCIPGDLPPSLPNSVQKPFPL